MTRSAPDTARSRTALGGRRGDSIDENATRSRNAIRSGTWTETAFAACAASGSPSASGSSPSPSSCSCSCGACRASEPRRPGSTSTSGRARTTPGRTATSTATTRRYPEGGIVPFRLAIEGLSVGSHSIHINYDFTASGHKAYDFLATWDVTNAKGKICARAGGGDLVQVPARSGRPRRFAFPNDGYKANGLSVHGAELYSAAPRRLTIYGGTITSISGPVHSGSPDGNSTADFLVRFKATRSAVLLAVGRPPRPVGVLGHVARRSPRRRVDGLGRAVAHPDAAARRLGQQEPGPEHPAERDRRRAAAVRPRPADADAPPTNPPAAPPPPSRPARNPPAATPRPVAAARTPASPNGPGGVPAVDRAADLDAVGDWRRRQPGSRGHARTSAVRSRTGAHRPARRRCAEAASPPGPAGAPRRGPLAAEPDTRRCAGRLPSAASAPGRRRRT